MTANSFALLLTGLFAVLILNFYSPLKILYIDSYCAILDKKIN